MWVDSCTIDLDGLRAGIRANTDAAADSLRRLAPHRVVDDPDAPRNFSVQFSPSRDDAHLLFWGGCVAARSFDPHRIVRALVDHLTAHLAPPRGLVWVESRAFVGAEGVVLMPARLDDDLRIIDRQIRLAGFVPVDSPRSLIDLTTRELVVPDLLGFDRDAARAIVRGVVTRRTEPTVDVGRYPLRRWVFIDYTGGSGVISRATATRAAVLEIVAGIEAPSVELLDTVAALFADVEAASFFPDYRNATLDALVGRPHGG